MTRFTYCFALSALLLSCSKEDVKTPTVSSEPASLSEITQRTPENLRVLGETIAEMGIDLEMVKAVHTSISGYIAEGSDEHMALTDLFSSEARSLKFNSELSDFGEALRKEWKKQSSLRSASLSLGDEITLDSFLKENKATLYWPYADEWDGKTIPAIAISTGNDNDDLCVAYKLAKTEESYRVSEKLLIDESYAQNNPVWVINQEALPYIKKTQSNSTELRSSVGHKFATLYLGSLQPTQHHDAWHKGGDEYHIEVSGPKHVEEDGKIKIVDKQYVFTRQEFTRKDIRNKRIREFKNTIVLISEWQPELNEIAVYLYENDASLHKKDNLKFKLSATWKGKEFGVDAELPFASGDDELYRGTWKSNFVFSTGNYRDNKWVQHNASGLLYTLPFQTNKVIYDPSNPIGFEP